MRRASSSTRSAPHPFHRVCQHRDLSLVQFGPPTQSVKQSARAKALSQTETIRAAAVAVADTAMRFRTKHETAARGCRAGGRCVTCSGRAGDLHANVAASPADDLRPALLVHSHRVAHPGSGPGHAGCARDERRRHRGRAGQQLAEERQRHAQLPHDDAQPAAHRGGARRVAERADDPVGREPVFTTAGTVLSAERPVPARAADVRAVDRIHPRGRARGRIRKPGGRPAAPRAVGRSHAGAAGVRAAGGVHGSHLSVPARRADPRPGARFDILGDRAPRGAGAGSTARAASEADAGTRRDRAAGAGDWLPVPGRLARYHPPRAPGRRARAHQPEHRRSPGRGRGDRMGAARRRWHGGPAAGAPAGRRAR